MTISKNNKMMAHLNYRMKVILQDARTFVGYFKAFDKHMNILIAECEEFRQIKPKPGKRSNEGEEKRMLGLILLRGENIVSLTVDGPPLKEDDSVRLPKAGGMTGPGIAKPGSRGVPPMMPPGGPNVPRGLSGPVAGVGGQGMAGMVPPPYPRNNGMPPRPF